MKCACTLRKKVFLNCYYCEPEYYVIVGTIKEFSLTKDANVYIDLDEEQINELIWESFIL